MRTAILGSIVIVGLLTGLAMSAADDTDLPLTTSVADGTPILHTTQLVAPSPPPGATATDHAEALVKVLEELLRSAGSDANQLLRLNVYAASDDAAQQARQVFARKYRGKQRPCLSMVVGTPLVPGALVSLDAVAVSALEGKHSTALLGKPVSKGREAAWAVLPGGPACYIAGQAERGKGTAESTRKTLASLDATLRFLKRSPGDVVQVKAFLHPMKDVEVVRQEIARYFGEAGAPPVTIVEWLAKDSIEIEMVVAGQQVVQKEKLPPVEYLTPPGMTASPIYSRVARINHGTRIYTAGLVGEGKTGADQVRDVFTRLGSLLRKERSDFKHLVKATYYVSTDEASSQLNVLRPSYYDPKRPPSASKASVQSSGHRGRGLVLDMIAVSP
jgi:enamine deaminase RidA (YjgF/YER057c/UK114 family)